MACLTASTIRNELPALAVLCRRRHQQGLWPNRPGMIFGLIFPTRTAREKLFSLAPASSSGWPLPAPLGLHGSPSLVSPSIARATEALRTSMTDIQHSRPIRFSPYSERPRERL